MYTRRMATRGSTFAAAVVSNVWEFLKKPDGTYAVIHDGNLLSDSIAEKWFARQICEQYGFCGQEYQYIPSEIAQENVRST